VTIATAIAPGVPGAARPETLRPLAPGLESAHMSQLHGSTYRDEVRPEATGVLVSIADVFVSPLDIFSSR
jgi:hypothetical protein